MPIYGMKQEFLLDKQLFKTAQQRQTFREIRVASFDIMK
jgi:hypothetical protein